MKSYRYWILGLFLLLGTTMAQTGHLSGLVFYDYSVNNAENAIDGFGLSRVYFTYQNKISDNLRYKFQTDVDYANRPINVYLKIAQMDWVSPIGKFSFGLQGMNVFSVQEKTWGLRYIEKAPLDLYKWAGSADMGIGYSNAIRQSLYFSVKVVNGAGYKSAETDSYKEQAFQLVYGERNLASKNGYNVGGIITYEPFDYAVDSSPTRKKAKTVGGVFGGAAFGKFRIGGEFERQINTGSDKTAQIIAAYGKFQILETVDVFGRYDSYDADLTMKNNGQSYVIMGLSYSPGKGLVIAPDFRYKAAVGSSRAEKLFKVNFEFKVS